MHPEILRELSSQRGAEMRDRAHRILLARTASKILRARRRGLSEVDEFGSTPIPPIPDFADGSFLVSSTRAARVAGAADSRPDSVPAARRAA
ncbi:MAG: hypothetical protein ABSB76_39385 [Streptosporangiaceae bacterium]|jgi:hypothetical protein